MSKALRFRTALGGLLLALWSWQSTADGKGIRFWNLTSSTVTSLELAPAGTGIWGPNQCTNDPDGAVDHDERLKLRDIRPGRYDVRITNKSRRACLVTNVEIGNNAVFSIADKDLTECEK